MIGVSREQRDVQFIDIAGKPMIEHVYQRGAASGATSVCVATDDERIVAAVERLELRERPYEWARVVATLQVRQGDTLRYDATRYQTVTPATVRVLRADSIEGRNLGRIRLLTRDAYYSDRHPRTATAVQAASTFEFLQHRAEGSCFVRVGGSVLDADVCPIHDDAAFRSSGEPVTRWWIRVAEPGRPPGWTRVGAAVREVGRTF